MTLIYLIYFDDVAAMTLNDGSVVFVKRRRMKRREIDATSTVFASTSSGITLVASVAVVVAGAALEALRDLIVARIFQSPLLRLKKNQKYFIH